MNRFEINKIVAAIVLTVVVVVGINKLADVVFNVKAPTDSTYKLVADKKTIKAEENNSTKTENDIDVKAFLALGNSDEGKTIFKKCAACHSISKGGSNKIGPALWGVIGRKAGAVDDYKYSKAMSELGKNWNFTSMNSFLIKPKDYVKGTKMAYAGLNKEKDRASIILYLNEQGDSPVPLP